LQTGIERGVGIVGGMLQAIAGEVAGVGGLVAPDVSSHGGPVGMAGPLHCKKALLLVV
jgi:hypothetical protein